jgi:hypothetical protein
MLLREAVGMKPEPIPAELLDLESIEYRWRNEKRSGQYAFLDEQRDLADVLRLVGEVKRLREREAKIRLLLPERPGLDHLLHQFVNPAMLRDILDGGTLYADYLTRKAKP